MEDKLYKAWQSAGKYYDLPDYDTFKEDMKDEGKLHRFHESLGKYYDVPDYDTFKADMGLSTAAEQQPTGQAGAVPAGQTASAGEMVAQGAQADQPAVVAPQQTTVQVKPGATQQQAAPVYNYTYFDESAIDPDEGELRMSMKPANWAYSERVNKSRGSHTKENSPILRMSLDGGKLDVDVEREALAELKDMSDDEIYKYTNDLYGLTWGELTNEQRRDAASRLAAAGYELHVRDLGLGHAGDVDRNTDEVQTNLQDPKYRKLYDQGQWADPVDALSRQYDRLFAEQANGGTMGQQQATKMANRVLRAADKDQMFTWALQEAERTGGDPYKIYENIYDRFHAAVKEKLGAYNTRGQAAGLLGDIDAMIAEKYSAAEEEDRSRGFNIGQMLADAENGGTRIADRLMNDPEMWALRYAKRTIEGVNNLIAEADHNAASGNFGAWLESSFAGGVARGFGQAVFDPRTWDMGLGDVRDATALMTALDKSDKGQPLTKAEQAMLDAKAVELAANAYFKSQVGYGYEAGKVTGESLPFMLEMMINPASRTGGLAVNKLVRYALKRFPQRGARAAERQAARAVERSVARSLKGKILESAGLLVETAGKKTAAGKAVRAAVKTAGNVAGSAVMAGTTGLPGVIANTENRMIGQLDYDTDEAGKAHVTGHGFGVPMIEAFKQALVARGIENVTEMSEFDVLSNWLGGLTRNALDKLHMSDVYKFFDDIKMSDVAKVVQDFEKNTHWQGTFGEYLEEVEGGILNAWLVGDQTLDQNPDTGVFNVDNNVKTFLGVSLLGGAFSTVQTVGYRTPKARMRKDIDDADKQASELWGGTWEQFKNSVDAADDEEMEVLLANIVVNGNYSVDQRRAAAQYIKSVVAYRGAMKGEEIRAVSGESNPESEQSYEQGYQVQGREREQVQDDLQRAEQRLDELDFDLSSFEGWTSEAFEQRIASGEHEYTDEDIEAIREYFRAKAASDGMQQRVEDDIDTQVQQASDLVDKQTNQGTGMVHRAVLNNGQEVYVTGGQLVMTGDGTMIDTEASDESLFVYNPATGQPEQYTPSDFQSVDDPMNPEQLKSEAAMDIRQVVEQQAEADMNGYVQQGEAYDMVDEKGNAMHGTVLELRPDNTAVVQVDGEQIPLAVQTQQLQTWVDNAKQARMSVEPATLPTRSAGARDNTANTGRVDNATNGTIEAPAVEPMPMDEKGEPAWEQSTPERGHQYLVNESGLGGEDITSLIDARIAQADAAIEKASKGGSINERLAARKAKDYWEAVKALHNAANAAAVQPAATGTTAVQSPTGQPTTTGQAAPAGTVRVDAGQAETMPVGYTAVNIDGTRAEDRGQLGIRPEDEAYFLKNMSPRMMVLLNKVAKSLGWKIRLYNGESSQERGFYDNGVVWLNRRAMTSKLAQWIMGHEMTHGMASRTRRGKSFKDYKALATAYHRSQVGDEQYEREISNLIKAYQDHLKSLDMDASVVTREYVEEEIACDVTGDLLMNNPEMIGKLFSGVESPGKVKGIIDMIVDFLNYLKSKLPWRSEEREAFDDLIKRLNNLYRDAKAQTDIAKETAREEGSQIESGEGEREGGSFSITGNAEGSGFTCSETVLEVWRVPQEDGTYKEEEHWVKKPLLDSDGNVVFRMGDKEFNGKNPITVDDLKSNPDTVLNYMLADALNAGTIDETKADQVRQQYADMLNLYLEKGMATEDGNGFENLEKKWLWVGETVFRTVASNSDEQYSYSIDITKVCKKNEAVIRAISAMQVKTGYGVTPAQILEIYETTDAEGFQVPCPVCYVFSRYINNGKYATAIVNGMKKYGKYLPGQPDAKPVEWWVKEFKDAQARAEKMETPLKHANEDVKIILQQIDTLCREITSGKLSAEEAESKRRHVRALDQRYRAALDVISQEAMSRWIKAFVIEGSDQGGWSLREDAALPEDMDDFTLHALDIRKTASAMEKYPSLTRYRRAGGSAGGKEITFASNNELGTIIMGLGISKDSLDDYPNYYQLAAEAATEEERQALLKKARERFEKAMLYAQRQTLRGGQRMWSWSDNIESLSSDVASNLMQLEMLGGALQTYSKQLEGVKMVAAMNGYVNASLMGYGDGIREVGPDEIDDNGRLKDNIWDVNNKGRRRIIANAGSPVYHNAADGKDYVLVFDDVVGIDPFGHDGKRGLFSLNEEYDRAGNILVGMNDIHVRAAMADPRVFFIIPWHASGMSNHILKQMFNILGVNMDQFVSTDYTKMQEETNYLLKKKDGSPKKNVPKEVEDFWDSHTFEDEFACGTGHIENGDRQGGLSESQLHYRSLRDAIFDGTVKEGSEEYDQIMADEFLSQVYRQVNTHVADGKMTEKDKEFIYPYEYWDETSTVENADVNGRRYVEYCRRMGFKPKFTGKFDDKTGYSPEGNFADDPGYWKLLIDRRMYDRRGNYQGLTAVDSSGLDSSMYDPDQTQEEFNVTEVATNEGAEKIAETVYQNDIQRTGTMPSPDLDLTMDEAVKKYNEVTALQASLIKAEREALKAAEEAKAKVEKAKEKEAADVDGRKAKSVAKAKESARKAMEMAKQKAREVEEIAGQFGEGQRFSLATVAEDAAQSASIPQLEEANDSGIRYSLRTKPAPKKTLPVYKLMRLGDDGKLYPLYIDGAVPIELGTWYDADSPNMEMLVNLPAGVHLINPETGEATSLEDYNKQHGITKKSKYPSAEAVNEATANGMRWVYIEPTKGGQRRFGGEARRYWNLGINGSGTVSTYSMRPGWHAGSLPTMRQIGKGPGRNLRDDRFVWVEGEISADVDYNEEAQGNPDNDIPTHIPVDGFYLKATNANAKASQADRVGWYISGAFKANRIMSDSEARAVIDAWNADPKHKDMQVEYDFPRESGKVFNAETMQLEDDDNGPDGPNGGKRYSIDDATYAEAVEAGDQKKVARMVKDAVKAAMPNTKAVDRWGKPRLLYHGTPQENQFYEFNGTIYLSSNRSVANEYTHYRRTFGANPRQTGRIMPVFVNLENPLEIDANRHLWRNIDVEWNDTPVTTRDIEEYAKQNGYDGVIIRRVRDNMYDNDTTAADVYIAFSPEQVKSAGPTYEQKKRSHFPWDDYMELDGDVGATYDDEGNLIPLSERFDMGKTDIRYSLDAAVAEAEQMTETNPTDGQKESGNYKKGHVKVDGFDISIEQPKGSVRSGVDADGKEWSQEMHNTYGYIRGTEGVDGDHIDVFLSGHLDDWNGNVYVVDQVNKDGSFDEHKVMYGFNSEQEARDAYLSNYEEGWQGLGNITGVSREEFKKWVDSSHRKNKPFAEYKNVKPLQSTGTGDQARFSISETSTDEDGREVYTERRDDGTLDREVVTNQDGSRQVTRFDKDGNRKDVVSYYADGGTREVVNYNSVGDVTRVLRYDEDGRLVRHWQSDIGTDWTIGEDGIKRGYSNNAKMTPYNYRFSLGDIEVPELSQEARDYARENEDSSYGRVIKELQGLYNSGDVNRLKHSRDFWTKMANSYERTLKKDIRARIDDKWIRLDRFEVESNSKKAQYAAQLLEDLIKNRKDYRSWGIKKNKEISMDEMDELFKANNKDMDNASLWERTLAVSRQLGIDNIKFKKTPDGVSGRIFGGRIRFSDEYFNDNAVSDNRKCETMLHEMIHHVTVYALDHEERLNDVQKNAVKELKNVYLNIKEDPSFKGMYGITNAKEMVAELANPRFRDALKKKNLFYRIVDSIRRIFFSEVPEQEGLYMSKNAYRAVLENFVKLLDNFNNDAYEAFAEDMRKYRPRYSLAVGDNLATAATYFSGGGLVEEGLKGVIDPKIAVEYDRKLAGVYEDNHGSHIVVADVRDTDPLELAKSVNGTVEYFHASPVCKRYSPANTNAGETELDIETAQATADAISAMEPKVVTIENVAGYKNSEALKIITDRLTELGYNWDANTYTASDYGAYTKRKRLIVRAVKNGILPAMPEKTPQQGGWMDVVSDLIPGLKETTLPNWIKERAAKEGLNVTNPNKPLLISDSGTPGGGLNYAYGDELAPTILANGTRDFVVMPDGRVLEGDARFLARITGLSDDYKLPKEKTRAHTIIGNGVPPALMRAVVAPLIEENINKQNGFLAADGSPRVDRRGKPLTPFEREVGHYVAESMAESGIDIVTDIPTIRKVIADAKKDNSEAGRLRFLKDENDKVVGCERNGVIYLDPRTLDAEAGLHEYSRLWTKAMRFTDPETWSKVVGALKRDTTSWGIIKDLNPAITDENEIASEMIAKYTGEKGKERLEKEIARLSARENAPGKTIFGNALKNIADAINEFWRSLGKWFGLGEVEAQDVYDMVLMDFSKRVNPYARVEEAIRNRDAEYADAAERGDKKTAIRLVNEALEEYIGNGIVPYISVKGYADIRSLARAVKRRDPAEIKKAARLMAEYIPDNAVLIPIPSHSGKATDMLDLANEIGRRTNSPVADVLVGVERKSQYQAKKEGSALTPSEIGIEQVSRLPDGKIPVFIDNVVNTGNTAKAAVDAVGKGVVVCLGSTSGSRYGRAAGIKSANIFDTDRSGNLIPLSKRFDLGKKEARFSLSLGAPYQGSKGQIATRVVDALPSGRRFVDLFAGGGAVTHAAMLSGKYGEYRVNDINPAGLELFLKGINGDYRDYQPMEMSAEEFKAIKGTAEGLMLSYGGLGRNVDPDKESVARRVRRVQRLEDLKPYADQVESSNSDYRDVELEPGDVVYADIPYEGTNKTGYRGGARFDKAAFSEWGLAQDVPVYVSEQSMPAGWVEVASWEMPSMNAQKKRGEKLFVQERFAGDGGNATAHGTPRYSLSIEEQERQTRSANFKNWFGDWENDPEHASKVVDEEGKPLVVYHANRDGNGFFIFDTSLEHNGMNYGSHFGTKAASEVFSDSEAYPDAKTYAVYLNLRNPLEVVDYFADDNSYWANLLVQMVNENNIDDPEINAVVEDIHEKWPWIDGTEETYSGGEHDADREDSPYQLVEMPELYKAVKKAAEMLGYDGFKYENMMEDAGSYSYVAFHPEQIKSATENNGDFSRDNPDIRYSLQEPYSVERGNEYVETFKGHYGIDEEIADFYPVDGSESLENVIARLNLSNNDIANLRDKFNDPDVTGSSSFNGRAIVIFTNKISSMGELVRTCFHEATHQAYKYLQQDEIKRYNNALMNWYRAKPNRNGYLDNEILRKYDKDDWANESMACFMGALVETFGWDRVISDRPVYNEQDIINFVAKIVNIITNGKPRSEEKLASNPSDQARSDESGGRREPDSGRDPGTDRGVNAPSGGTRWSLSGDGTVEEYNKAVNMTGRTFNVGGREVKPGITRYNFQEAFQDSILSVKKLQQVVERHFGIKLPTRENAWMYENRLSSINMHERKSFIDKVYEPMMKIADRIMKRGVKEKELNAYLICKHGLERNRVFAQRDANEEANEIARNGGTPDMQQLLDKYRQRDYSGLTGVTGIQGDIADIEAEAQRIVDEFEQKHGQLCNELWDAIRKATQWSLRKSYQSGMMSAATFDHVRNMFQYYIPLRGWSETTAEDVYSYMMGEHGAFNGVLKRAEGRTSVADDPLATIGNMAESALMQGNKNLLKQHLLRMAQNHPTDVCQVRDVWLVEGPGGVWEPHWPNIPDDATPDEIDQILQDHEADMLQLEAGGGAKRVKNNLDIPYRIDPRHVPEHAVVAKVAGIDHVVYINGNPRAAQAINGQTGAGRGTKSGFSRLIDFIFGDMKRFYSSVLTSLNINFSGANFVRDLPHAYAMTFSKYGPLKAAEYIAKSFQVIPWVFKNQLGKTGTSQMDRYFQEFLASGAVTGYAHINDVDAWKADNKRRFARLSALGKAKVAVPRALGEVINAIGWFSETLELIPRFTAFLVERQAGKDIATATKAAKDITTNFNKKGSEVTPGVWGAVANTLRYMKMFFNPIVQGMYQFVDVASMGKENKWVGPRMVLATMHLPILGAIVPYLNQFLLEALGGDDDDDYWLLNEYTRRNNVCLFTGNGYVKIPIAPVFRELYGMGEVVATRHAGKADNEKTTVDLIDQLRTMGSVEGQSSYNEWSLARFLLPEHFAPLIDVMNNENFTGGPIYYDNNYKEYAPEYTKAKKSTWSPLVEASKWLNEMMGGDEDIAAGNSGKWMNPAVWQHLITNVGGGFAQLAGDVVSGITDIAEGKEIDASNMPIAKRFYSNSSDERAQWARFGIYKDYEKEYTKAKEKYQALDKRGLSLTERADEVAKFAERHPKAAAIYAVWEGGINGADIPQLLEKMGKDDPAYWELVKDAVGKAEKAMNSGYVRAWEQKRKDRPDSMSDKELNERFDKSDNDSIRHIMADEISKRAGSQDYRGRDAQATWSDKSIAAWETYQRMRTSDDIKADAELSDLFKAGEDEKDKERVKMLGYIKDELNKIRRGKDATSRSAGVKGLGEGDDERVMNELRSARKQLIEDLKTGSAEQAYRNLERRTMRLGLRKKAKEM